MPLSLSEAHLENPWSCPTHSALPLPPHPSTAPPPPLPLESISSAPSSCTEPHPCGDRLPVAPAHYWPPVHVGGASRALETAHGPAHSRPGKPQNTRTSCHASSRTIVHLAEPSKTSEAQWTAECSWSRPSWPCPFGPRHVGGGTRSPSPRRLMATPTGSRSLSCRRAPTC